MVAEQVAEANVRNGESAEVVLAGMRDRLAELRAEMEAMAAIRNALTDGSIKLDYGEDDDGVDGWIADWLGRFKRHQGYVSTLFFGQQKRIEREERRQARVERKTTKVKANADKVLANVEALLTVADDETKAKLAAMLSS